MNASFYISDAKGFEGKLFFTLTLASNVKRYGTDAAPTSFDGVAEESHIKLYPDAYKAFKKENPTFKLKWPELDVDVSQPEIKEVEKAKKAKE